MIRHGQFRGYQRGAVAVEAALILPSLLMIAAMTTGGWRLSEVRADAQSAAEVAARAGSVASTCRNQVQRSCDHHRLIGPCPASRVHGSHLRPGEVHCPALRPSRSGDAGRLPRRVDGTFHRR